MIEAQKTKLASMVIPQSVATTEVTGYCDTLGAEQVKVVYYGAPADAADVITGLKLQHSETTSNFTDIDGAVGGTDFTIPVPNTSTPNFVIWQLNRQSGGGLKRYVNVSIVGDATARLTSVHAELSRLKTGPTTDAEAGASEVVYV